MRTRYLPKEKGVTLIELLVALVICAIAVAAIYRLFIVQTRAYTVQDEVVEVQQTLGSAMEILLRDLRMAGYDDDCIVSRTAGMNIPNAFASFTNDSISINYEYVDATHVTHQRHGIQYWRDSGTSRLFRQRTVNGVAEAADALLENVDHLRFIYGIDTNEDGMVESWPVDASGVGFSKIIAVRVTLTARPSQTNPDVAARVSPRTLTCAVTFRNIAMKK
jgi:prepilin-type N-terminal cleavage/methylation domain-containing protein